MDRPGAYATSSPERPPGARLDPIDAERAGRRPPLDRPVVAAWAAALVFCLLCWAGIVLAIWRLVT